MAKSPFRTISPADLEWFAPAALKSFRHPGGGNQFLTETPGGGETKILLRLRGGYVFFTGTSAESTTPLQQEILNSP